MVPWFHCLTSFAGWLAAETDQGLSSTAVAPGGFGDKGCGFLSSLSAIWLPVATGSKQLEHVFV